MNNGSSIEKEKCKGNLFNFVEDDFSFCKNYGVSVGVVYLWLFIFSIKTSI